jgi:hypothetical protein
MRKTAEAIWQIFLKIWLTRNGELYGKNYEAQKEIVLRTTLDEVTRIYEEAKHYVNDAESRMLHSRPLEQILNWSKAHLDAYLATAEVILEQNIDQDKSSIPLRRHLRSVGSEEVYGSTIV